MRPNAATRFFGDNNAVWSLLTGRLTEREARRFADNLRVIYFSRTEASRSAATHDLISTIHGAIERADHADVVAPALIERELTHAAFQD